MRCVNLTLPGFAPLPAGMDGTSGEDSSTAMSQPVGGVPAMWLVGLPAAVVPLPSEDIYVHEPYVVNPHWPRRPSLKSMPPVSKKGPPADVFLRSEQLPRDHKRFAQIRFEEVLMV